MSIEDGYDAWVRGLMGSARGADKQQADAAAASLADMQARLDALTAAKKRSHGTRNVLDAVDKAAAATTENVRRMSSELTHNLRTDGLLQNAPAQPAAAPARGAGFEGLAAEVRTEVLGQDAFVADVVKAFRRPFVMGTDDPRKARGPMLLCGPEGTGRHYTLRCVVRRMADRGLLPNADIDTLDLALYPGPAQEKLFLQDLYAALQSPAQVLAFDHYEACAASYLNMLADLAMDGTLALSSRYVLQRGILVDVGTALAPGAVGELSAGGKYFVFFSEKDEAALADRFGARFVDALAGDICRTDPFTPESLAAIAARELNFLAQKTRRQCGLALSMGADLRDYLAAQYGKRGGMSAMRDFADRLFRALAEYVLSSDTAPADGTPVTLTVRDGRIFAAVNGGEPFDLLALLPQQYRGDVEAVEVELDRIVGLDEVKAYVRDIAKNVQAQQRRKAQGLPVAEINMHMIFTGNPGTGKTTIARILAKYLKAIGALAGGQLVEVGRADLVGRYVGHTAPLTNQVINSALGGVLFIDEAYSLYRGGEDSFGLEAIDTLVKGIEDHRNDLVVVLAGYTREMQTFLAANSGLASRFPNQIEFPDYLERAILNQSRRLVADPAAPLDLLLPGDFELDE